jgi:hypothetical protein
VRESKTHGFFIENLLVVTCETQQDVMEVMTTVMVVTTVMVMAMAMVMVMVMGMVISCSIGFRLWPKVCGTVVLEVTK